MFTFQVIMRYINEVPSHITVPPNVLLSKWLPQNDLLGDPKVRLFLTHGGANGQSESLFHGKPMIVFPLFGDQFYNAKRGQEKGFSLTMDILSFQPQELVKNIETILVKDSSFQSSIRKASAIYRSAREHPRERAAFWIEHVMKYGGAHLRSHALDMTWYEFLMLDILALILGIVLCVVGFFLLLIRTCCKLCSKTASKQPTASVSKKAKKTKKTN